MLVNKNGIYYVHVCEQAHRAHSVGNSAIENLYIIIIPCRGSNGFNILLYGLGSKRDLLEQFQTKYLSQFSHLVVNGYFPSLTIKQVSR